jgi:hypothetical protein
MKTKCDWLRIVFAWSCLLLPSLGIVESFTNLYSLSAFDVGSAQVNSDGGVPLGGVIVSSNILYGTTVYGGSSGYGTVLDGTGFTSLYAFTGGSDGKWARTGLAVSGNNLFGATTGGGNGLGNIYSINTTVVLREQQFVPVCDR